jgi:hypothetical protein
MSPADKLRNLKSPLSRDSKGKLSLMVQISVPVPLEDLLKSVGDAELRAVSKLIDSEFTRRELRL